MAGSWRRWADAIIFKPEEVVVVEATIVADPSKISQLELYLMLYNQTPELPHYDEENVEGLILYAVEDQAMLYLAHRKGLRTEQYQPTWLDEYLELLQGRKRTPSTEELPPE